jgi:protein ImuB
MPAQDVIIRDGKGALVTAHRDGNRLLVAAVSRQARALGLDPGMPLTQARILVPGLDVRDADIEGDRAWLTRLALFAARRWTPRAAVSGPDGLWLDLTGVTHLFGGEARMCERILAFCRRLGFAARIALAGTLGAAHSLARHGDQPLTLCPVNGEARAIAGFPLAALRLDTEVLDAGRRLGIERVGELIAMPRAPLQRRFGSTLLTRLDQALGRVGEPYDPIVPEEPPEILLRFLEPIATPEAIAEALGEGMRRLVPLLEETGLGVRCLVLLCDRIDGDVQRAVIGTARATRDGAHLFRLMAARIETLEPGFGLESLRLVAARVEPLDSQLVETGLGEPQGGDLAGLVDRLAVRLGRRRIYRLSALESDLPERSVACIDPLGAVANWPKWPRPARLVVPPEPVDQVMSALPDGPPRRFRWRGRDYQVTAADGPERVHGEWWRRAAERETVRDYFQVEVKDGARFWLFREGDGEGPATGDHGWRLHGIFA